MRSILFSAALTAVGLYALLFIVISLPPVQNSIRDRGAKELSKFFNSKVEIGNLQIIPFNEVRIKDVKIFTPKGEKCVEIENLGAAIRLWRLITEGKFEITYVELIGLDGKISQATPDSKLNIDFIIKAFQPKEKKEPSPFDVKIYNIVIRKSKVSFDKLWIPNSADSSKIDFAHLKIENLRADLALPQLKNDDFLIDLRRLSLKEKSGLDIDKLSFQAAITSKKLKVDNFLLRFPSTTIEIPEFKLSYKSFKEIKKSLYAENLPLDIQISNLNFSDFHSLEPKLSSIRGAYNINILGTGNLNNLKIQKIDISNNSSNLGVNISGDINKLDNLREFSVENLKINAEWTPIGLFNAIGGFISNNPEIANYITEIGNGSLDCDAEFDLNKGKLISGLDIHSQVGEIGLDADCKLGKSGLSNKINVSELLSDISAEFDLYATNLALGQLLNQTKLGRTSFSVEGNIDKLGKKLNGEAHLGVDYIQYNGLQLNALEANISKHDDLINMTLQSENALLSMLLNNELEILPDGNYNLRGDLNLNNLALSSLGLAKPTDELSIKSNVAYDLTGNNLDNLLGQFSIYNLNLKSSKIEDLNIDHISLLAEKEDSIKRYEIDSDFLSGYISGDFNFSNLATVIKGIIGRSVPSLNSYAYTTKSSDWAEYKFSIQPNDDLARHLKLNVRPAVDVTISGSYDASRGKGDLVLNAPYLIQGKNKLIKNTSVDLILDATNGLAATIKSNLPVKNDRASIQVNLSSFNDNMFTDISWMFEENKTGKGEMKFSASISRNPLSKQLEVRTDVIPTSFFLNGAEWKIDGSKLYYSDKYAKVDKFKIWHGNQYLSINGVASQHPEDLLNVGLNDINLDYIFNTLNINYVTFGGDATGEIDAKGLFTGEMDLQTKFLKVHNFSYNNTVLGEADIRSYWDRKEKMVSIQADIAEKDISKVKVNGGIYVTRDSLSFDMSAEHVNLSLLKPFMSAFTSDVGGRASGELKLFGNFSDIDMTGKAFADSVYMKVDYTNVYYNAKDSVYFKPGRIVIPPLTLHDKYGNTAVMEGYVKHRYFHDPVFQFTLSQANKILGFDTSAADNPIWYGKIFASGRGALHGVPGLVSLQLDMTTEPNSQFTFSMEDTQVASEYTFLTFSDRNKVEEKVEVKEDFESEFLRRNRKKVEAEESSVFEMDIRCSITEAATLNLIMDPKAGDKIVAHGSGPMQISYNTEEDAMQIYGKYTLSEGNYNFSLQDLILRDFKIKEGSNISFNGDVMKGVLDIVAAYRVNTNLSDLDKSFSTDRDLNRTSVPVDALLKVNGAMTNPEISFDISLPTLTEDVERKVKSIISTEDQMSRQIIYLLALNRFYTPEYMGATSNGGAEIASVASTTVSSQLSNFIGQLTDKVSLTPSFRSEKGDFSDMEVDVALSSRLLNNRLLINGNFGYRDRTTSQTTFIGDFDIEYLLNKNGNLRLKAYNHFNDQYYYLQSALTTQGLGVIYRKDFDNPFKFLRKRKKNQEKQTEESKNQSDSTKNVR